ncbi:hypothetical protein GCM10022206_01360 [Streptomyces chiangmaiensis]
MVHAVLSEDLDGGSYVPSGKRSISAATRQRVERSIQGLGYHHGATGALCAEHLAMLGHRDIAVIGEAPAVYERHAGFTERTLDGLSGRAPASWGCGCCTVPLRAGTARWP